MDTLRAAALGATQISGGTLVVRSPIDSSEGAALVETPVGDMSALLCRAQAPFASGGGCPLLGVGNLYVC